MKISNNGLELIKRFEGFSSKIYVCPGGHKTIGYGHLVRSDEIFTLDEISEVYATEILRDDIEHAEQSVERLIHVPLSQGQFDALVSFTFNLGSGALQA